MRSTSSARPLLSLENPQEVAELRENKYKAELRVVSLVQNHSELILNLLSEI